MQNEYIVVPLKRGFDTDLRPILTFIESAELSGSSHQYHQRLTDLMTLRAKFVGASDVSESTLQLYYRYADQIMSLESKVPLTENQVRVNFKWQDAFAKSAGRLTKTDNNLTMASGIYERFCVLFNVAALGTAVAEQQNKFQDDGLKMAAKLFQQACGIFSYLSQLSSSCFVGTEPTQDLQQAVLNTLATISLAQAQDIFVRKAMTDNMKSAILAKLSEQCAFLYDEATKLALYDPIKNMWSKEWLATLGWKKLAFQALAQHFDACANQENKKYGIAQARIKNAKDIMLKAVAKCNCKTFPFLDQQKLIDAKVTQIEKENAMIFHEKVPPTASLPPIEKAVLAKPTAVGETTFSTDFKDLLAEFVPLAVSQAAKSCEERRIGVIQKEVNRIKEANSILNSALISFNLPACVEDVSGERVPKSILEKSRLVRTEGGVHHLDRLVNDLPSMLAKCTNFMDDSERQLGEEESADKQLRAKYQSHWTRTPSEHLNSAIKQEMQKYRTIIGNAQAADRAVRQRYANEKNAIIMLSQGDADIENYLPPVPSESSKLEGSASVAALRQLIAEADQVKKDRTDIESQIKNAKFDALSKFTAAYQKSGVIYEESLSLVELDKAYGPLRDLITKSTNTQDRILQQMKVALAEFNKAKGQDQRVIVVTNASRDVRLRELASAYECYKDLSKVAEEGAKFYTDLLALLEMLNQRIRKFCDDRNREKEALVSQMPEIAYQPVQVIQNPYATQAMYQALPGHTHVFAQPSAYYVAATPVVYNPFISYQ